MYRHMHIWCALCPVATSQVSVESCRSRRGSVDTPWRVRRPSLYRPIIVVGSVEPTAPLGGSVDPPWIRRPKVVGSVEPTAPLGGSVDPPWIRTPKLVGSVEPTAPFGGSVDPPWIRRPKVAGQ